MVREPITFIIIGFHLLPIVPIALVNGQFELQNLSVKKYWAGEMPVGRIGQPSDIGKTAVFLASDDSSFMLGAELLVDGGMTYLSPTK